MGKLFYCLSILCFVWGSIYSFTACDETNNNNSIEDTEYTIEAVNKAITDATQGQSPEDIKVGQYFKYEDNYLVELTDPKIIGTYETEILDILETTEQYILSIKATRTKFDDNGLPEKDITEETINIKKNNNTITSSSDKLHLLQQRLVSNSLSMNTDSKVKVYNLKIEDTKVPYPLAIQSKMNCDSASPCMFHATRIRFIVHEYLNKNKPLKFAYDRIYMSQGHFLTGTYSTCISEFIEGPKRDYYLKRCSVLRDYKID